MTAGRLARACLALLWLAATLWQAAWAGSSADDGGSAGGQRAYGACAPRILSTTAARASGLDGARPLDGWETVSLPDIWSRRWRGHDGWVWYRIDWTPGCAGPIADAELLGLSLDAIRMTGEIHLNDTLLWRDTVQPSREPLGWNLPRWWMLPRADLRDGTNTLWVRVAGHSAFTPGLGRLEIGTAADTQAVYARSTWRQRTIHYLSLGLSAAAAVIFLTVWLLRPAERAFGWYGLMSLCWVLYLSTILAADTWPFGNMLAHSRLNNIAFVLYAMSFCIFTWRFGGQELPRLERALKWLTLAGIAITLLLPRLAAEIVWLLFAVIVLLNCLQFPFHAWRTRQLQHLLMAACWLSFLAAGVHGLAQVLDGRQASSSLTPLTSLAATLFVAVLLGWRLASGMRRIQHFNHELQARIDHARTELADALEREHTQALAHAKLQERMHIVHDLHDGLGGSLVRSLALVERAQQPLSNARMLSLLKVMRDDLRQIIDHGSSAGATVPATPTQWIAPLRHRFTALFDELDIASQWQVDEQWCVPPSAVQCLGLIRLVEETLSNVIKHSRARHVRITLAQPEHGMLRLTIQDDGIGFDPAAVRSAGLSVGMRSMAMRIERLGGKLEVASGPDGTTVGATLQAG